MTNLIWICRSKTLSGTTQTSKHGTPHTLISTKIIRFLAQITNGVFRQLQNY